MLEDIKLEYVIMQWAGRKKKANETLYHVHLYGYDANNGSYKTRPLVTNTFLLATGTQRRLSRQLWIHDKDSVSKTKKREVLKIYSRKYSRFPVKAVCV